MHALLFLIPTFAIAQTPTAQRDPCRAALDGRVAWNAQGEKRWAPANIDRLCKGGLRDEPAKCFDRVMHGRLDWGGGVNWEWKNAIDLCQGSQNADATIFCFRGQMRAKIAWENGIANCGPFDPPTQPPPLVTPVAEVVDDASICKDAVQGRIPWNAAGEKRWGQANLDSLCNGGVRDEPAKCFDRLMRGQVNWGGGTNWEWKNGSDLCRASQNANATIACFEGQIKARATWEHAITQCTVNGPGLRIDHLGVCRAALQGRIPWNDKGDTKWEPANMDRLCTGGLRDEPAKCFDRLIRGQVNWGGGTNWEWANAVDLCEGTIDQRKTISCFEQQVKKRVAWEVAIKSCSK